MTLKTRLGFLSFALLLALAGWNIPARAAAGSVDERTFSMSEVNQMPFTYNQRFAIPLALQKDSLFMSLPPGCAVAAKRLQLTDKSYQQYYIFSTLSRCGWTDETAPAWILQQSSGSFTVILSTRLQDLRVRPYAHSSGIRNLAIGSAISGKRTDVLWVYDPDQSRYVPTNFPIESN